MALPTSGPMTMAMIAAEFGGTAPHSLGEYLGAAPGIPVFGQISMNQFYGKSSIMTTSLIITEGRQVNEWIFLDNRGFFRAFGDNSYVFGNTSNWWLGSKPIHSLYMAERFPGTTRRFIFQVDANVPQSWLSHIVTEDGWVHWSGNAVFTQGAITRWEFDHEPWGVGGWDGVGTRWVDIYHRG